jgi:hypothetical protein
VKLKELQDVLFETRLSILLFTNRLRRGECESEEKAIYERLQLADFMTIKADLEEHIQALEQVLQIGPTGRKLRSDVIVPLKCPKRSLLALIGVFPSRFLP